MMEFADTPPVVPVEPAEYHRLLGYPRDRVLTGRSRELADWAREWYGLHGRPWIYARQTEGLEVSSGSVRLDGVAFTSRRLETTLQQADAHSAFLVAAGAGPEAEEQANRLWREDKPDEYFFLEIFGSAVVEHLFTSAGARLCAWADEHSMAVLPHYSPGYSQWDISEQGALLNLIQSSGGQALPGKLEVLGSGALLPKKSQLGVFGLTRHTSRVRRLTDLVPCENCSFAACQFRRMPYLRARRQGELAAIAPLAEPAPAYQVNPKALKRWAAERLKLETLPGVAIRARFRYDGTTCANMGRPLAFDYTVTLDPRQGDYLIREETCAPAPGDTGHTHMCQYQTDAPALMAAIASEAPLLGQPLNQVFSWRRPASPAGCYCESAARDHKWGLVLETIHYALHNKETNGNNR
jgi:hypothetical protein